MAQEFLNDPQIGATFKKVGGEGMTQCMRRRVLLNACLVEVFAQHLPETHPR